MFALELKKISKSFGSFQANSQIDLNFKKGEIHAILGENGAGKSTLMKIIYGEHAPDAGGEIFLYGKKVKIKSSAHAISLGIGMVHQHFRLIKPFTILQNIILGVEPKKKIALINYSEAKKKAQTIAEENHILLDFEQKIENLSVGVQQQVEIFKVLYRNAEIIILDEPTAVLTPQEIKVFYTIIRNLKKQNKTIIIITHKLHEIKEIADRCSILRKGKFIETLDVDITSEEEMAQKMVGRKIDLKIQKKENTLSHDPVLVIQGIDVANDKNILCLKNFSLRLGRGQITGLAGINGNGQNELVEALTGLRPVLAGEIFLNQTEITNLSPLEIYHYKLSSIPEDRQSTGLILDFKIKENFVLQKIDTPEFSHYGFILNRELINFSQKLIARFDIRPENPEAITRSLSGGNQQKIILAREISHNPDVLIAFQPTRGLDVGAIEYIHRELIKLRDAGKAILLISYELDEIINLSDRIAVVYQGSITNEIDEDKIKNSPTLKEHIGLFMAGGN